MSKFSRLIVFLKGKKYWKKQKSFYFSKKNNKTKAEKRVKEKSERREGWKGRESVEREAYCWER